MISKVGQFARYVLGIEHPSTMSEGDWEGRIDDPKSDVPVVEYGYGIAASGEDSVRGLALH